MRRIRIILAEDQPLVRAGVRKVLDAVPEFEVVGEAGDGDQMLKLLRSTEADLVVLDLNMPRRDGFEVLRDLRALTHPVKVLVLSLHDDPVYVGRAVREGAHGYLLKDSAVVDLPTAVRTVMGGQPFFSLCGQAEAAPGAIQRGREGRDALPPPGPHRR